MDYTEFKEELDHDAYNVRQLGEVADDLRLNTQTQN